VDRYCDKWRGERDAIKGAVLEMPSQKRRPGDTVLVPHKQEGQWEETCLPGGNDITGGRKRKTGEEGKKKEK